MGKYACPCLLTKSMGKRTCPCHPATLPPATVPRAQLDRDLSECQRETPGPRRPGLSRSRLIPGFRNLPAGRRDVVAAIACSRLLLDHFEDRLGLDHHLVLVEQ